MKEMDGILSKPYYSDTRKRKTFVFHPIASFVKKNSFLRKQKISK